MKRIISVLLIALMLCSILPIACFAEENNNARASNYFSSYGTTLSKQSDGRIKIVFSCTSTGLASQLGVATYLIQEKDSDGSWDDFSGLLSGKTATDVHSYTFSKYFTPRANKQYRVKCVFTCIMNGSGETKNYTSGTI